jgi:alkylation response protein AidB-like acyl-CoA dehydrogenase
LSLPLRWTSILPMDLKLATADLAFRDEVRRFLDTHLTNDLREAAALNTGTFCDFSALARWHKILFDRGWVAPAWPVEHGGPGWTNVRRYLFASECAIAGTPGHFSFGTLMCGPVLIRFGTNVQKQFHLPRILSGEHRWCQGYSEPGSGSDLASLQTRAIATGVTGSKIWTTFAHHANWIFCLVRTNTSVRPQEGITFLLIDLKSPGITVKPILNIAGDHEFNEVFFDNVRVPKENRVGNEGAGWAAAKYLLEFERGTDYAPRLWAQLRWTKHLARLCGADELSFATRLVTTEIDLLAFDMLERRVMSALSLGQTPGPASSMLKLRGSELVQQIDELALDALGTYAAPWQPRALKPGNNEEIVGPREGLVVSARYLYNRSVTIFGGTSEVQRNILARAALDL